MSGHYSKYGLNTCCQTPYFQDHLPKGYPIDTVLQKCRAFRRLPPHLKELSAKARVWLDRVNPTTNEDSGIDRWYDAEGYELNPGTGARLSDAEIEASWPWPVPDVEVKDIPVPDGGFPDPQTWKEPAPPPEEPDLVNRSGLTEKKILSDIASRNGDGRGRLRVCQAYGVPLPWLSKAPTDADLAQLILGMHGKPWPPPEEYTGKPSLPEPALSTDAEGHQHKGKGEGGGQFTSTGGGSGTSATVGGKETTKGKVKAAVNKVKQAHDWLHHKGEAGFKKLPKPVQYVIAKTVTVAFTGWTASQKLAERISREKGATPAEAAKVRSILAAADLIAFKPMAIATAPLGGIVAAATWIVPPVTGCYLVHSTALHPIATYRAAKGLVGDALKGIAERIGTPIDLSMGAQ